MYVCVCVCLCVCVCVCVRMVCIKFLFMEACLLHFKDKKFKFSKRRNLPLIQPEKSPRVVVGTCAQGAMCFSSKFSSLKGQSFQFTLKAGKVSLTLLGSLFMHL